MAQLQNQANEMAAATTSYDPTAAAAANAAAPPEPKQPPIFTLRDGTLHVRRLHTTDAASVAVACNNPAIARNMRDRFPSPYTLADADKWIAMQPDRSTWGRTNTFAADGTETVSEILVGNNYGIISPGTGPDGDDEVIGSIGLMFGEDISRRSAEMGYWLKEEWWGKGIMTEVVTAFVSWTWKTFPGLGRLYTCVFSGNPGSVKVVEKAGFQREGLQRRGAWKNGAWRDINMHALLREN